MTSPCRIPALALAAAFLLHPAFEASGRYAQADLAEIPISRLIANISAAAREKPDDAGLQHHLARAHAIAYANNLGAEAVVKQHKGRDAHAIWFGYQPSWVPFATRPRGGGARGAADGRPPRKNREALDHLAKAITAYEAALALEPKDAMLVRLGLGWCRKEAGDRDKALAEFRLVIEEAWKKEGEARLGGLKGFVCVEAIGYALPLLDADDDADEIADLTARRDKLNDLPRPVTPVAVPLRDGIGPAQMIDRRASVAFDLDASGFRDRRWQWLHPAEAAWLVYDADGSGEIRSAIQMFGSRSFMMFFEHGYDAMALLDDDADGFLRGSELRGLALWNDRDSNGVSDPGEVSPLASHGIEALRCDNEIDGDGVRFSAGGVEYSDGSTRPSYDLIIESSQL